MRRYEDGWPVDVYTKMYLSQALYKFKASHEAQPKVRTTMESGLPAETHTDHEQEDKQEDEQEDGQERISRYCAACGQGYHSGEAGITVADGEHVQGRENGACS